VQDKRKALRRTGKLYNSDSCWAASLLDIGRIAIDYRMFFILYKINYDIKNNDKKLILTYLCEFI